MSRVARESYSLVPETCPIVDKVFGIVFSELEKANATVKIQTKSFRNALDQVIDEKIELEAQNQSLKDELSNAEERICELENIISQLEKA